MPGKAQYVRPQDLNIQPLVAYTYQSHNHSTQRPTAFAVLGRLTHNNEQYFVSGNLEVKREYGPRTRRKFTSSMQEDDTAEHLVVRSMYYNQTTRRMERAMTNKELGSLRQLLSRFFQDKYPLPALEDPRYTPHWMHEENPFGLQLMTISGHYRKVPTEELPLNEVVLYEYESDTSNGEMASAYLMLFQSQKDDRTYQGVGILEPYRTILKPEVTSPGLFAISEQQERTSPTLRKVATGFASAFKKAAKKAARIVRR